MSDRLLLERAARALHRKRAGDAADWSALAPTLKDQHRQTADTLLSYVQRAMTRLDEELFP